MGMSLYAGGHLTHGHQASQVASIFQVVQYGVRSDGWLDYEAIFDLAKKEKPRLIVAGATAYPRRIDFEKFKKIAEECGAYLVADISHIAGLVACGLHQSPFPYSDIVTTTTHKTLRGPRGGLILCQQKYAQAVDKAVFPGLQGGPSDHVNAAKAVCLAEASTPEFKEYGEQIIKNAQVLAAELLNYGFDLVTGGTDNHLLLIDLTNQKIKGREAEVILEKIGLTVNKNVVPRDQNNPQDPSGIRLGTPALTTRGLKEEEVKQIAWWIAQALKHKNDERYLAKLRVEVKNMALKYPVYGID